MGELNMVKCSGCGHENDPDATFCENCGSKIGAGFPKGTSKGQPVNGGGMAQSTKILIVVCVVLVIGVGITAGYLLKNNQQPALAMNQTASNSSANSISKSSGFPVSEAPNLGFEIIKNNGTIASITYGTVTLDKNQCLYIMAKAITMLNSGQSGNIPINSYGNAANPAGTVTSASITKAEYLDIASRTYSWMDSNGDSPNYVGIINPGQPDLSPDTTLNLFAKVLSDYKSTGQLPASVSIP
jgi:hypothetical protein